MVAAESSSSTAAAAPAPMPNDSLFYKGIEMAWHMSHLIKNRYFRGDERRIKPGNKFLWPLRHEAYKRFGI
jgi:hypothetical protein